MPRQAKPWHWEVRNAWYTDFGGVRRKLASGPKNDETERLAMLAFHKLMLESLSNPSLDSVDHTVASVIDEFLEFAIKRDAASTFYERKLYLLEFCDEFGPQLVRKSKPLHLSKWVDSHETWKSPYTQHYAMRAIMRPFNWGAKMGLIEKNPFIGVEWPECESERRAITVEEFTSLLDAAGRSSRLGEILRFLAYTGCRPCELRNLRWSDVRLDRSPPGIFIRKHKTSKRQRKKKPRIMPILNELGILLAEIAARHESEEFVFVTDRRTAWARSSIQQSLRRLRRRIALPEDVVLYGIRHHVATQSVLNGVDVKTTGDILGHTNLRTTDMYVHSSTVPLHLVEAVEVATRQLRNVQGVVSGSPASLEVS